MHYNVQKQINQFVEWSLHLLNNNYVTVAIVPSKVCLIKDHDQMLRLNGHMHHMITRITERNGSNLNLRQR